MLRAAIAIFLSSLLTFSGYTALAQRVRLLSSVTNNILTGAAAQDTIQGTSAVSDGKGWIDLRGFDAKAMVRFSFVGHQPMDFSKASLADGRTIYLKPMPNMHPETVVSASRFEEGGQKVPQQVEVIRARQVAERNQQTTADLVATAPGVFVQRSQLGGGSPILRGFEANKILLVMDGMRLNNAIYRGGHLQNIITMDQSMLDRVEVDLGPGNVMYGADALGGVIHFRTKDPILNTESTRRLKLSNGAYARFSSANNEFTGHVDLGLGFKKWGSLTALTFSEFKHQRMGNIQNPFSNELVRDLFYVERVGDRDTMIENSDRNMQVPTAYSQFDILQKFYFKPSSTTAHRVMFQMSNSSDIPRYDNLEVLRNGLPRFAEWYYGPQQRYMGSYSLTITKKTALFDGLDLSANYQYIGESRHNRKFQDNTRVSNNEAVHVAGLNLDLSKQLGRHALRYGLEAAFNQVNSTAFATDIITKEVSYDVATRYPDGGSQMGSAAAYLSHTWEAVPKKFYLTEGVRYTYTNLTTAYQDTVVNLLGGKSFAQNYHAANGNLGFTWTPTANWSLKFRLASGFRAPNVDDVGKVFELANGLINVPNADLKPTYLYSAELGLSRGFNGAGQIGATGHFSYLTDAIVRSAFTYNGQDSIQYNGETYGVVANQNKQQAYIAGVTAYGDVRLWRGLSLSASTTYTYGRILTDTVPAPLDHVAPLFGNANLVYRWRSLRVEFFINWNAWKALNDMSQTGEDRYETATTQGVPAWYTLNLRAEYNIYKNIDVQVALENLLDQNYRPFASGLFGKGRNAMVCLRARF